MFREVCTTGAVTCLCLTLSGCGSGANATAGATNKDKPRTPPPTKVDSTGPKLKQAPTTGTATDGG